MIAGALLIWGGVVAYFDYRMQRVSNQLLLPVFVMALLVVLVNGYSLLGEPAWSALLGMMVAALPWMIGYVFRQVGAGDVKFAAVLGLTTGWSVAAMATLITALLVGLISLQLRRGGGQGLRFPLAPALVIGFAGAYSWDQGWMT